MSDVIFLLPRRTHSGTITQHLYLQANTKNFQLKMLDVFTCVYLKTFNMFKTVTILLAFFSSFWGEGDLSTENFLMLFLTAFLP